MELTCQKKRGALTFKGWTEAAPAWTRSSTHGGLELGWADAGALGYRIGQDTELTATAGHLAIVPEGVEHCTWLSLGGRGRSVHVGAAALSRLIDELGPRAFFSALEPMVVPVPALTRRLCEALEAGADPGLAELAVLAVLQNASGKQALRRVRDWRLMRALEHLFSHWDEPLDVEVLARVAGLSRFHFSRCFEERVGQSPYQFVLALRLDAAARALERGASVTGAATGCGFSDLSRFSQQFRRRFGQRPSEWGGRAAA